MPTRLLENRRAIQPTAKNDVGPRDRDLQHYKESGWNERLRARECGHGQRRQLSAGALPAAPDHYATTLGRCPLLRSIMRRPRDAAPLLRSIMRRPRDAARCARPLGDNHGTLGAAHGSFGRNLRALRAKRHWLCDDDQSAARCSDSLCDDDPSAAGSAALVM